MERFKKDVEILHEKWLKTKQSGETASSSMQESVEKKKKADGTVVMKKGTRASFAAVEGPADTVTGKCVQQPWRRRTEP